MSSSSGSRISRLVFSQPVHPRISFGGSSLSRAATLAMPRGAVSPAMPSRIPVVGRVGIPAIPAVNVAPGVASQDLPGKVTRGISPSSIGRPAAPSSASSPPATRVDTPAGPVASSSARRTSPPSAPLRRTLVPKSTARGVATSTSASRRTPLPAPARSGVKPQPQPPRLTFSLEKPAAPFSSRRARAAPAPAGAATLTVSSVRRASRSSLPSAAGLRAPLVAVPIAGPSVASPAPVAAAAAAAAVVVVEPDTPLAAAAPEAAVAASTIIITTTAAPPAELVAEEPALPSIALVAPAPPTVATASATPGDDTPFPGAPADNTSLPGRPAPATLFPAPPTVPTAPTVSSGARRSCLAGRGVPKKTAHARFAGPAEDSDDAPFRASQDRRWYSPKDRPRRFLASADVLPEYLVFTGKWDVADQLPLSARADVRFPWDEGWASLQRDNNALRSEGRLPDYYDLPSERGFRVGEARLVALDLVGHLEELEAEEAGERERQREARMAAFLKLDEERVRTERRAAAAAEHRAAKAGKQQARRLA
ncbi:MAG: hypothetical protein M1829_002791 [Trizodia sp. TS-e1964]|nr:MAG: hypothetical protein M1829_002791 [Trizodia sp. TS-e1964]